MKHLTKRGTVWYVTARVNGKRISQSTGEMEAGLARQRAAAILRAARDGRWAALEETKARRQGMTLGEAIEAYQHRAAEEYVRNGRPRPETVTNYVSALRLVVRDAGEPDPDAVSLANVNGQLAKRYAAAVVGRGADNQDRARRTAASTLRNARAVFARWPESGIETVDKAVKEFCSVAAVDAPAVKYRLPAADLVERTKAAGRALADTGSDLYPAWLACYWLGLRASEAASARWDWIREIDRDGRRAAYLDVIRRDDYRTKGTERSVPLAPSVRAALEATRRADSEYLLPGNSPTERLDLVRRKLAAWMRELGWSRADYPKAAHELRKLMGSEWYTRYGVEVACKWLGHASIQTTHRYYADLTRHPDPIEME
jgi:integrase